jgi:hypothetical protein
MTLSLQDWLNEGKLRTHKTSKAEIGQLLAVFDRDLADAQVKTISTDRRFAIAYSAALTVSMPGPAASGYRTSGEGHHYWTIQSLASTLQLDAKTVKKFNKFRQKRNISDYERTDVISEQEVEEMISLARTLRTTIKDWLLKNYPELVES